MANYTVNYNDKRFTDVKNQEQQALNNVNNSDKYYNDMINAAEDYGQKQQEIQQANTDFAIEKIEQQKANTQKDYEKEQRGAYTDYARQVNPYGIQAESAATSGIARGSGVSESARIQAWAAYQGRIGQARDTYQRAVQEYDNGIKDAMLANNAKLAEIAYQSLSKKLELGLNQFQYKNTLLGQQLEMQQNINNQYYQRWQNVLQQINTENSLAEQIRQYNQTFKENQRQYNTSLKEEQRQFNEQLALQKKNLSSGGSGGSRRSSGGSGGQNGTYGISGSGNNNNNQKIDDKTKNNDKKSNDTKTKKSWIQELEDVLKNGSSSKKKDKKLKGEDVLKENSAFKGKTSNYNWYAKNIKGKNLTSKQLYTKLVEAQKNKKLTDTQIRVIAKQYGIDDGYFSKLLTTRQKVEKKAISNSASVAASKKKTTTTKKVQFLDPIGKKVNNKK